MTAHAYLDTGEAAELLGQHQRTVRRRAMLHEIPALQISPQVLRIEAVSLDPAAPPPIPPQVPAEITIGWLSKLWRVHPVTLTAMAGRGELPMEQIGGCWVMSRRQFLRFVNDHSTGDGW